MNEVYLPAESVESEGLDSPWDDDSESNEWQRLVRLSEGSSEVTRVEAVEIILSAMGTKIDDADLTNVR